MIQLAFDLGMQTAQPAIWSALQSDCCDYGDTRVSCDGSQRVTEIRWYTMGLNGVINGTAIPTSVTFLHLWGNAITGSIPDLLPSGLLVLDLWGNAITGNIPNVLPSGLITLWLYGNQMSGDLISFPSTIQYLSLGYPGNPGNHFTGTLRINQPIFLLINDNWVTDVVIQDSSQINPSWCDLSNNPLLGNPNIAGLTTCTKNGLYSAALLPVTRSTTFAKTTTTSAVILKSVLETATQLGSSEMTTLVGTSAMAIEFPTITAMQTVPETTTMKAMHLTSSGITATRTTTLRWASIAIETIQLAPMMRVFAFSLFMVARVLISGMLLIYVISKSPFRREFKRMMSKTKTTTTSAPDF